MGPTNYDTWQNEVGKVVERPPPDVQREVELHVLSILVLAWYSFALEFQKVPFLKYSSMQTSSLGQGLIVVRPTHPVEHVPFRVDVGRPQRQVQFKGVVGPAGEAEEALLLVERKPMFSHRPSRRRRPRRLCHSSRLRRQSLKLSPSQFALPSHLDVLSDVSHLPALTTSRGQAGCTPYTLEPKAHDFP